MFFSFLSKCHTLQQLFLPCFKPFCFDSESVCGERTMEMCTAKVFFHKQGRVSILFIYLFLFLTFFAAQFENVVNDDAVYDRAAGMFSCLQL